MPGKTNRRPSRRVRKTDPARSAAYPIRHSPVPGWIRTATAFGAAAVLSGCGTSQLIRVPPQQMQELDGKVRGESRIRFRSGATSPAYDLEFQDGAATWRPTLTSAQLSAPLETLDSVQLRARGRGAKRGLGIGLFAGLFTGVVLEVANGNQNGWLFDESDRRVFSGIAGSLLGAVVGSLSGAAIGAWEDRYRFESDSGESP